MGDTLGVYTQDLAGCLAAQVGAEGLDDAQFADAQAAAAKRAEGWSALRPPLSCRRRGSRTK